MNTAHVVNAMIESGADINVGEDHPTEPVYVTALYSARDRNTPDALKLLLEANAKPTFDALLASIQCRTEETIDLLLEHNAHHPDSVDINQLDSSGTCTLLSFLAEHPEDIDSDPVGVASLLLKHGASPNALDGFPRSPLGWAVYNLHYDLASLLLENGGDASQPFRYNDDHPMIESLLNACCKSKTDKSTVTIQMAKLLIQHGANPFANTQIPLIISAVISENKELVNYFLDLALNPNGPQDSPWRPIHVACNPDLCKASCGHILYDIVDLLIKRGVGVNNVEGGGVTALHYAASAGYINIARLWLENGANVTLKAIPAAGFNGGPYTAFRAALTEHNTEMAELLKQHMPVELVEEEEHAFRGYAG